MVNRIAVEDDFQNGTPLINYSRIQLRCISVSQYPDITVNMTNDDKSFFKFP